MRPNIDIYAMAMTLMAVSRVRLDRARELRMVDKRKALIMANEAHEIAVQAKRLLTE